MKEWQYQSLCYADFVNSQKNGIRNLSTLFELLTYLRPAQTDTEAAFVTELLKLLPATTYQDGYGNIIVDIGENPAAILFSCHTDMVCSYPDITRQNLMITDCFYVSSAADHQLGADDGAGIWLMLNLINANISGRYIFHRDEEIGGLGSLYLYRHRSDVLVGIKQAIAFDRRDRYAVVTNMNGQACCSEHYASKLCQALAMRHKPDKDGGFTDVTRYIKLIDECTNISVGYFSEHQHYEKLDYFYCRTLRDKLLTVNWQTLLR